MSQKPKEQHVFSGPRTLPPPSAQGVGTSSKAPKGLKRKELKTA